MGGSILLPNWSAYSGTPSQMVALKVVNMVNIVNMVIIHLVIDSGSWQPGSSNMVSENSTPGLSGPKIITRTE